MRSSDMYPDAAIEHMLKAEEKPMPDENVLVTDEPTPEQKVKLDALGAYASDHEATIRLGRTGPEKDADFLAILSKNIGQGSGPDVYAALCDLYDRL